MARLYSYIVVLKMPYDKMVTDQCADLTYAGAMDFKDGADKTVYIKGSSKGRSFDVLMM